MKILLAATLLVSLNTTFAQGKSEKPVTEQKTKTTFAQKLEAQQLKMIESTKSMIIELSQLSTPNQ
jgi:hypothetical protein